MSMYVLNSSDTMVLKDTVVVKFAAIVENCQPIVKEAETNWQDSAIVISKCMAAAIKITDNKLNSILKQKFDEKESL